MRTPCARCSPRDGSRSDARGSTVPVERVPHRPGAARSTESLALRTETNETPAYLTALELDRLRLEKDVLVLNARAKALEDEGRPTDAARAYEACAAAYRKTIRYVGYRPLREAGRLYETAGRPADAARVRAEADALLAARAPRGRILSSVLPALTLTVPWIMRTPAMIGAAPRSLRWSADGEILRFRWGKPDGKGEPELREWQVKKDGTGLGPATAETREERLARVVQRDGGRRLYEEGGALYLTDPQRTEARRLDGVGEGAGDPQFVDDGKAVVYLRRGDPFKLDLATGRSTQLAHLVRPPLPPVGAGEGETASERALAEETARLLKGFSRGGPARSAVGFGGRGGGTFGLRGSGETGGVAIALPEGARPGPTVVSPTGRFAAVEVSRDPESPGRATQVPSYVTRDGYTAEIPSYPKVGEPQPSESILLVNLDDGKTVAYAPPRPARLGDERWSPDGRTLVFRASANDHKDAWIVAYDTLSGTAKTLWDEHDDAWVGGPGAGFLAWTPGGRVAFESERDGFANLWTMAADGSDAKALVKGDFEVSDVTLDEPRGRFVFTSSAGSPFRRHVDAVPFSGGEVTKLAELSADEDAAYAVAPDGTLAVVRSSAARPAELWIGARQVTDTPTEEWKAYPWIEAPIVRVPARDGQKVPAKLYRPKNWKRGGPAVIFVHGAGYLQNVYEGWSHYYRETMFNQLLISKGYAVLDLDFRASAGYGKAWRTAIYRHMGGKDLDDNVDGARFLVRELGANPKRIGLYGGSYGGFLTLMAMFKEGDTFAAGAALRPVADWRNYHPGYTSPILNDPQDDPQAYAQSSPIEFAEGLKGQLLICHGMVDVNVHFQDSVRLVERLIELGKTGWSIAPYPVEDHAFTRPESWTDEYRRILELFDRTIGPGWKKRS